MHASGTPLENAGVAIPHIRKRAKGGEDAFFVASTSPVAACGVADGVGGWAAENVDPRLYPTVRSQEQNEIRPMRKIAMLPTCYITICAHSTCLRPGSGGKPGLRIVASKCCCRDIGIANPQASSVLLLSICSVAVDMPETSGTWAV